MIVAFTLGLALGTVATCLLCNQIVKEQRDHTRRWHRRALDYMELWWQENEKRRKAEARDDGDWWKT